MQRSAKDARPNRRLDGSPERGCLAERESRGKRK